MALAGWLQRFGGGARIRRPVAIKPEKQIQMQRRIVLDALYRIR
jgi:hypothetical protein